MHHHHHHHHHHIIMSKERTILRWIVLVALIACQCSAFSHLSSAFHVKKAGWKKWPTITRITSPSPSSSLQATAASSDGNKDEASTTGLPFFASEKAKTSAKLAALSQQTLETTEGNPETFREQLNIVQEALDAASKTMGETNNLGSSSKSRDGVDAFVVSYQFLIIAFYFVLFCFGTFQNSSFSFFLFCFLLHLP